MKIIYFKEEQVLTKRMLEEKFKGFHQSEILELIGKLKATKVLKVGSPKQNLETLNDIEDEFERGNEDKYYFTYVGILTFKNSCLIIYPKYIEDIESDCRDGHAKLQLILNVIDKFQILNNESFETEGSSNALFSLMIDIVRDYWEKGLYSTNRQQEEINGEGLINWDKTLERSSAYLFDNTPYYLELITEKTMVNMKHIVTEVHEAILNQIMNKLNSLLSILSVEKVTVSGQQLADIGDEQYLIYVLENELNRQFITSKQETLKKLLNYLKSRSSYNDNDIMHLYGSSNFNLVWEDVCKRVYKNDLEKPLNTLGLVLAGEIAGKRVDYSNCKYLKSVVDKPKWTRLSDQRSLKTNQTLILDVLQVNHKKKCFQIYDAKYYRIGVKKNERSNEYSIFGQPGVGDITKQYLYQLAFKKLAELNNYRFENAFIIPKDDLYADTGTGVDVATVKMDMLSELGLEDIRIIARDCETIYKEYLSG